MPVRSPILIGSRFTRLTVIGEAPIRKSSLNTNIYRVNAICDCGNTLIVPEYKLRFNHTRSCGCLQVELAKKNLPPPKHQKTKTPEYRSWQGMKARCGYNKDPGFKHYGERGIKVCDRWINSFENFLIDMKEKPNKNFTLERLNTNGDYEPWNCIWADWNTQSRNRRNNVKVALHGKIVCVSEACDMLKTHQSKIVRMVKEFNITHQEAVDLYDSNLNFRDYRKILFERKVNLPDYHQR